MTESWEQMHYAQVVSRSKPWHITGGPGFTKDPHHTTVCGERGSVVGVAHGELPRFAKLCEKCQLILRSVAERELPPIGGSDE